MYWRIQLISDFRDKCLHIKTQQIHCGEGHKMDVRFEKENKKQRQLEHFRLMEKWVQGEYTRLHLLGH